MKCQISKSTSSTSVVMLEIQISSYTLLYPLSSSLTSSRSQCNLTRSSPGIVVTFSPIIPEIPQIHLFHPPTFHIGTIQHQRLKMPEAPKPQKKPAAIHKRKSHKKSRNGCRNCRLRSVKVLPSLPPPIHPIPLTTAKPKSHYHIINPYLMQNQKLTKRQ